MRSDGRSRVSSKKGKGEVGRREFIKNIGATTGLYLLPTALKAATPGVEYIRKAIPEISVPAYRGGRYADRVPDTLDLTDRASLAINALTGVSDPVAYGNTH